MARKKTKEKVNMYSGTDVSKSQSTVRARRGDVYILWYISSCRGFSSQRRDYCIGIRSRIFQFPETSRDDDDGDSHGGDLQNYCRCLQ